ncbi:MAG TPA: hypothetical protein VEZ48_03510 [Sphingomonadaceae bacterium]|jgi:hypothetical protein|nr:hypothetical protein [Sphingomonadaceae bacterium]
MVDDIVSDLIGKLTSEVSLLVRENNDLLRDLIAEVRAVGELVGDLKMEITESTASIMGADGFTLQDVAAQIAATEDRITGGVNGEAGASLRRLEDSLESQSMLLLTKLDA